MPLFMFWWWHHNLLSNAGTGKDVATDCATNNVSTFVTKTHEKWYMYRYISIFMAISTAGHTRRSIKRIQYHEQPRKLMSIVVSVIVVNAIARSGIWAPFQYWITHFIVRFRIKVSNQPCQNVYSLWNLARASTTELPTRLPNFWNIVKF